MSERNWLLYIAIGGLILGAVCWCLGVVSLDQAERNREHQNATDGRTNYAEYEAFCSALPSLSAQAECLIQQAKADYQEKNTAADLHAQQDMAAWTKGVFWVGLFGFVTGGVGLIFLYDNLKEMKQQTLATREIGENQSKAYAWVPEVSVVFPKPIGERKGLLAQLLSGSITARLTVKNEGQTPAIEVSAWAIIEMTLAEGAYLHKIKLEQEPQSSANSRVRVIAPMQPGTLRLRIPDKRETAERERTGFFDPSTNWGPVYGPPRFEISGTLQYRDVFSDKWYHSTFKFLGHAVDDGEIRTCVRSEDGEELFRVVKEPRLPESDKAD